MMIKSLWLLLMPSNLFSYLQHLPRGRCTDCFLMRLASALKSCMGPPDQWQSDHILSWSKRLKKILFLGVYFEDSRCWKCPTYNRVFKKERNISHRCWKTSQWSLTLNDLLIHLSIHPSILYFNKHLSSTCFVTGKVLGSLGAKPNKVQMQL